MAKANSSELKVLVTKFGDRKFWRMYYDCPLTGKRISRSTKQTTQKAAEKAAHVWEAELNEGRYIPDANIAWGAFRERFLSEHLQDSPAKTYLCYATALNAFEAVANPKKLAEVNAARIANAAKLWREGGKSLETVASYLRHLRAALNWAVKQELLHTAPRIEMPKRQRGAKLMKGRAITGEEFERMLDKVEAGLAAAALGDYKGGEHHRYSTEAIERKREEQAAAARQIAPAWKRLLKGLWLSGLRLGEALNLSWDDDDKILVELGGKRPMLRILAHQQKGGRDSLLPITPDFYAFLLETPKDERTGPVFKLPGIRGEQVTDTSHVSRVISIIGEAAGIIVDKASGKFASAHDLRRAFGVRWALKKVSPAVLKELMRHTDISTTMKYYAGLDAETVADAIWQTASPLAQTNA